MLPFTLKVVFLHVNVVIYLFLYFIGWFAMRVIEVKEKQNNKKLDSVLLDFFPNLKQNTFYKALRKKDIRINDVRVSENMVVHTGDKIKIFICDELLESTPSFSVVYEDDFIFVVNKPAQLEVTDSKNSLTSLLEKKYPFIKPCHRIDRNTTGLVLFAKTQEALDILLAKFKQKEIEKHYKATVYGILDKKQARLTAYLFKDNKKSFVYISDTPKKGYQKIVTSYQVISENKKEHTSVLDVNLETGKTHQIRAHLAHIGFPIIGDGKYGNYEVNRMFSQKTQLLHSSCLIFQFVTPSGILEYLKGKKIEC